MGFGKTFSAGSYTTIIRQSEGEGKTKVPVNANFHEPTTKDNPAAVMRKNKNDKEVYELIHPNVSGVITNIFFKDTDFGKVLSIVIDGINIQMGCDDEFFSDFAKKLPNINIKEEVKLTPYYFLADGKTRTGVSVMQGEEKIRGAYYDGEKNLNGFPEPQGDKNTYEADDWKIYFMQVKKFLIKEVEALAVKEGINSKDYEEKAPEFVQPLEQVKNEQEEFDSSSLPF